MLFTLGFTAGSCSDDDDVLQAGYGYAQFKLYKGVSTGTRASTNELDYLRDAQKMKIVLINQEDGTEIVVRTTVFKNSDGTLMTEDDYLGKTINVKGFVNLFDGSYQINVLAPKYVTIVS